MNGRVSLVSSTRGRSTNGVRVDHVYRVVWLGSDDRTELVVRVLRTSIETDTYPHQHHGGVYVLDPETGAWRTPTLVWMDSSELASFLADGEELDEALSIDEATLLDRALTILGAQHGAVRVPELV